MINQTKVYNFIKKHLFVEQGIGCAGKKKVFLYHNCDVRTNMCKGISRNTTEVMQPYNRQLNYY